ncbi:MAG TPA: methyltransferase domain-containing protein [Burkholderiales bacterium]|nr:methyltransferase domain-containing protein [Burkholderiales bacterium]
MRHPERWKPTKFVNYRGRWQGSRDTRELSVASRLAGDLVAEAYARDLPLHVAGRLLDLGCGKAPLHGMLCPHVQDSCCADWPGSRHGSEHVDVFLDLNRPLPFRDCCFRTVLLSDVLEHVYRPLALWREINRVLETGGKLVGNTPFLYWIHEAPHDYYRYTEHALARMAGDAGFRVLVLEPMGGPAAVAADLLAKQLAPLRWIGRYLAQAVQAAAPRRAARGSAMTLGYFMVAEKAGPARG